MTNPLTARLRNFAALSDQDAAAIDDLCGDVRPFRARQDLMKEGETPDTVFVLLDGWACRYKLLANGRRQIIAYLLPGDLSDLHVSILKRMDHSVSLLSDARVAVVPRQRTLDLIAERPHLTRALWWSALTDEAVLREWIVNIGQRDAYERIAHLFVELLLRMRVVGRASGGAFMLPLTQTELGDTLGLTPVHVNRMLQRMRQEGLIELARGRLHIPDVPKLKAVSRFDPTYLHLGVARSEADSANHPG